MDAKSSLIQPTFLFDDCKRFNAQNEHDQVRSSIRTHTDIPSTADPWKQRPIDFTMKNFHPNRKKNRNHSSNEDLSLQKKLTENSHKNDPNVMRPFAIEYQHKTNTRSLDDNQHNKDKSFRIDTRIEYENIHRMLNTEQYKNPQLHDFRQYPDIKQLGLTEFQTTYDRDPYNIRFLSNRLNTLWLQEREHERIPQVDQHKSEMYRALTAKPRWESRLILPKLVFPNKYVAYTRYRNPTRTVQSAYWERVENYYDQEKKLDH